MGLFRLSKRGANPARNRTASRPPAEHLRRPIIGFAVVDVETTGFSPRDDRIVEIGIVLTDEAGAPTQEWSTRVNPQRDVGPTHIHGISQRDVASAPTFSDSAAHIADLLRGRCLVAHNAAFDRRFLEAEFGRAYWAWPAVPTLCTLAQSSYYLPQLHRRRLSDCCRAIGFSLVDAHTALGDARATAALLHSYLGQHRGPAPKPEHQTLLTQALNVEWPSRPGQPLLTTPNTPPATHGPRPVGTERRPYRATPRVACLLDSITLDAVIEAGAPQHSPAYIELLIEALRDGELSPAEQTALGDMAQETGLSWRQIGTTHEAFAIALADRALLDGTVQRAERAELKTVLDALGLEPSHATTLLKASDADRRAVLSQGLDPLPDGWIHGEPLRVGDRVVFTGCDPAHRKRLEETARDKGVRVTGSVSGKTSLLVSDGATQGSKADKAVERGTPIVHPATFEVLLAHIQPAHISDNTAATVEAPRRAR